MNPEPDAISAALRRAWRAVAKAFAPAPDARASQQYGVDTTLFGASTQLPRDREAASKNEFWVPTENTDFAEIDGEGESRRRR